MNILYGKKFLPVPKGHKTSICERHFYRRSVGGLEQEADRGYFIILLLWAGEKLENQFEVGLLSCLKHL